METGQIVTSIEPPTIGDKVGGWLDDTIGEGSSAICQTCCSPCVLLTAILVLFIGEFTWVQDQNNIMQIDKDMIDGVTKYEATNDGKPVAFYAASTQITAAPLTDAAFGVTLNDSLKVERVAYMLTGSVTTTTTSDNKKVESCSQSWTRTSSITTTSGQNACAMNPPYSFNNDFKAPCQARSGTTSSCGATLTGANVKADQYTVPDFLIDYYTRRNTPSVTSSEMWGKQWQVKTTQLTGKDKWFACGTYLSNNYREDLDNANVPHGDDANPVCVNGNPASRTGINANGQYNPNLAIGEDHSVSWEAWKIPSAGFTICSKQTNTKSFEVLNSDSSYDLMLLGKKSKADCIQAMTDRAKGQVMAMRVIGFLLFWCGFCMMFALVSFFADRVGSLIPCGLGEMFSDCVDCMITVVTCPPAFACWLFWFSLAWLIFNPMPWGILFVVAVVLMGGMYWWFTQQEGKSDEAPDKEEAMAADQQDNWNTEPAQQVAQPWGSDEVPTNPPPPADANVDANNDGIPDQFQDGLPPGWVAAIDHTSGRVYWVNHNESPATSTWQDPRAPSEV